MKLDKIQREGLQDILSHPNFSAIEVFLQELAKEIGVASVLNLTEWDHLKGSLQKEYQIALLNQLVNLMEQVAAGKDENA